MRILLPLAIAILTVGCLKKTRIKMDEIQIIERDTDILDEEDLEELPEN